MKSDQTYVDSQNSSQDIIINTKANASDVNSLLLLKANTSDLSSYLPLIGGNIFGTTGFTNYNVELYTSGENNNYAFQITSVDCHNGDGGKTAYGRSIKMKASDLVWSGNRLFGAQMILQSGISQ